MMKPPLQPAIWLSLFTLLSLSLANAQKKQGASSPGPHIHCDTEFLDLGEMEAGPTKEGEFIVKNLGKQPLQIFRVQPSCGCTTSTYEPKVIPVGAMDTIPFSFDTKDRIGDQEKSIVVFSNDEARPELTLTFRAVLTSTVTFSPRAIALNADHGRGARRTVLVENHGEKPLRIERVGVSDESKISATIETVTTGTTYKVHIDSSPKLPIGPWRADIKIYYTGDKDGSEKLPVYGNVHDKVAVSPDVLLMAQTNDKVERQLVVRGGSVRDFNVLSVEWPGTDVDINVLNRMPRGWIIRLGPMQVTRALHNKPIIIKTDVEGKETLTVPVVVPK